MLRSALLFSKIRNGVINLNEFTRLSSTHDEYQYLNLIQDVLSHGDLIEGRNGKTKTVIGASMHFDLSNNTLPLLTTKKVAWKTCLKELLWFIRGQTDNNILTKQNVGIWNGNASREFLDKRGLTDNADGDLGPIYGHQWRHFNAEYKDCNTNYDGKGEDQLSNVINLLKNPVTRSSRRMVISAWNPCQINEMALPPCHILMQFNVIGNKLSCSLYQRSADIGLGVPFNIASYSMLTHLIAKHVGLQANDFYYHLGNCHIYDDHSYSLSKQTDLLPNKFPTINILSKKDDIGSYCLADFVIKNYKSHPVIKMEMRQ